MADQGDARALRGDPRAGDAGGGGGASCGTSARSSELEAMAHRWEVARLLEQGLPYLEIAERTGASTTTVTRVAHWLRHGEGGYRLALDRGRRDDRLRVAAPGQGPAARAVVPAARGRGARPGAAGRARARVPVPQRAGRGAARARGRRARVRAGRRRRLRHHRHRPRARARRATCTSCCGSASARAGSRRPCRRSRRCRRSRISPARRVATVYPRLTRAAAAGRRRARRRHRLGRDRAAARPRRRDRRPRLVAGTRCARTACARSACCSSRRRCWSPRDAEARGAVRGDAARGRRGARATAT